MEEEREGEGEGGEEEGGREGYGIGENMENK